MLAIAGAVALASQGYGQTATCRDLRTADTAAQLAMVAANRSCAEDFINLLLAEPATRLPSFYAMVTSPRTTDAVFMATYEKYRFGEFRFPASVIDSLAVALPQAAAACAGSFRCPDWNTYILPGLQSGGMFRCPSLSELDNASLIRTVPYGDYACTEAVAAMLFGRIDEGVATQLVGIAERSPVPWSRRNAMRVLGRAAEARKYLDSADAGIPAIEEAALGAAVDRLEKDREGVVLHEAIWILDAQFFPYFNGQAAMEAVVRNVSLDSALRFRTAVAVTRLLYAKAQVLDEHDTEWIVTSLRSDDPWVRAQTAYFCESASSLLLNDEVLAILLEALNAAWDRESQFSAKLYVGKALDRFGGTTARFDGLKAGYEATHLPGLYRDDGVAIRSSLPYTEMARLAGRVASNTDAFFQAMGEEFREPVPGDRNSILTLVVFESLDVFREYMADFLAFTATSGGVYIEETGTLYTYQRTASQSIYSLEHLLDHEQSHYLQGRYVYPGYWQDSGYHAEPKGWADEGLAEYIADGGIGPDPSAYLKSSHLAAVCSASRTPSLTALLQQRTGYEEAGTFDYDNAWAFVNYLMAEHRSSALNVYTALRQGIYRLADFPEIFGGNSLAEIEADWHRSLSNWCQRRQFGQ